MKQSKGKQVEARLIVVERELKEARQQVKVLSNLVGGLLSITSDFIELVFPLVLPKE